VKQGMQYKASPMLLLSSVSRGALSFCKRGSDDGVTESTAKLYVISD
jgi:hypothetical protein